ncbi:MAG: hypothetical protein Q9166_006880 [cf. Caloplaca sp. 2 TL-2023]
MAETFQLPPIPPIDPDEYTWRQSDTDSSLWQRRACGVEAIVGFQANASKGEYDLFYATTTELHDEELSLHDVKRAARAAWRLLRYEEPQIAGTAAFDGQVKALLQYQLPKNEEEVEQWLDRTILVEASDRTPMAIRDANEEDRKRKNLGASESATIYIAASVPEQSTRLDNTELRILFRINHLFFDGIGFRCMIACFFRGLVAHLPNSSIESEGKLDWNNSVKNLPEPYIKLLLPEQHLSGSDFDASLQDKLATIARGSGGWGMSAKSYIGDGPSKTLWRTFTKEQSQNLVKVVKERLGPSYTITHLGQAALLLALVKMHPPGPDVPTSTVFCCATPINGRRYIQEPYRSYNKPYFPNCQVSGFVLFEDIKNFMQEGDRKDEKTKELLVSAAKQSKDGYAKILNRPHNLASSTSILELFANMMT